MRGVKQASVLAGAAALAIIIAGCQKQASSGGTTSADSVKEALKADEKNGTNSSNPKISRVS
jgi:hypothetical protein